MSIEESRGEKSHGLTWRIFLSRFSRSRSVKIYFSLARCVFSMKRSNEKMELVAKSFFLFALISRYMIP